MTIFPAIDLMNNQCVRLRQGRADAVTVYNDDPVDQALRWESEGGSCLHLVDLDGAFQGKPCHTRLIERIIEAVRIPVEVGGGLRTDEHVRELLDAGVDRVILGTRAASEPGALRALVERFRHRIAVGIDARDGFVQVKGWVETTGTRASDLACDMAGMGVRTLICTDTATDGMLQGPNLSGMAAFCDAVPDVSVVASGGISRVEDVRALAALQRPNLAGVIVGKALYEGTATLPELIGACRTSPS